MKIKKLLVLLLVFPISICTITTGVNAAKKDDNQVPERMYIYKQYARYTDIPWYIIGAIDQYERNTKNYRKYCKKDEEIISICFDPVLWSGYANPREDDQNLDTIYLFQGMGVDGDGDGLAERLNTYDRLQAMLNYISSYGKGKKEIEAALLNYYKVEKGVNIIFTIAKLFEQYDTVELGKRVFPIPKHYAGDYTNNYGTGRSWGGYRIHEGVDIFSHYGTPVVSTAYGVVEIIGWNEFGGYRLGIRDMYNTYEYYAHLNGYAKGLEEGDIVEPGQVIGYVGSTGYGKEGTSGKFPPHLHFGFYKFDGRKEWSFNPYHYINKWERVSLK
ncbi:M23 family metallopeptidase [Haloplasma contractile]|uniref:L-Ala--D-Glu endopeptidase protein n=1 Tax=Haloplasma contractile SSD-17B TaxID=1033810 RepID=U2FPZ4_9MOLU|nr:M23 family metallopeptidase [Haloplasma contractile]ERJ13114.1 L-Ala--D-Glu endopeptidase protein [Haloplasma contractile SSD-17B]